MAAKESLAEMIKKEHDALMEERKEALTKLAEIDKKLEPVLAYLGAGKKKAEGKKRGRKSKAEKDAQNAE